MAQNFKTKTLLKRIYFFSSFLNSYFVAFNHLELFCSEHVCKGIRYGRTSKKKKKSCHWMTDSDSSDRLSRILFHEVIFLYSECVPSIKSVASQCSSSPNSFYLCSQDPIEHIWSGNKAWWSKNPSSHSSIRDGQTRWSLHLQLLQ